MSTQNEEEIVDAVVIGTNANVVAAEASKRSWFIRSDAVLEKWGEYFNPIMVKECRQALKNMQFVLSFFLTLLACWLWSVFSTIDAYDPNTNTFNVRANDVLMGYLVILAFPLIVIVPYIAFRSLASERDDKTFELLAVTTLSPRQIVAGKLFSSFVQISLYFSAVLPCLAFSYLLQGIDFPTIAFSCFWIIFASVIYTLAALLLGTIAKERFWQILLSVGIIMGVCISFIGACNAIEETVRNYQRMASSPGFAPIMIALAVNFATFGALFFVAAASQITFASDNRSTALRICVLAQSGIFLGSVAYVVWGQMAEMRVRAQDAVFFVIIVSTIYYYCVGLFAVSEPDKLSPRVKRGLPQSNLGMMLFNLLYPGPGRGYLFAVAGYAAMFMMCLLGFKFLVTRNANPIAGWMTFDTMVSLGIFQFSYLLIYLGLSTLILRLIQRRIVLVIMARIVFQVVLLMIGMLGPTLIVTLFGGNVRFNDVAVHLLNPMWSMIHIEGRRYSVVQGYEWTVLAIGVFVFLLNIPGIVSELRQSKMVLPERVQEEEKSKEIPPVYVPQNPWDEPETAS